MPAETQFLVDHLKIFSKPGVLQGIHDSNSLARVVRQQFHD